MQIGFETIREILEHRLHQDDIERLLDGLDEAGKAELFYRITEMLRRTTALADIANRVNDSLSLDVLFPRLMEVVTEALNADRSTLFLHDPETGELFSRVLQGDTIGEIRFPSHLGVAGSVFTAAKRKSSPTPMPMRASTRRSTARPVTAPATSSACRSATRSAR
jgi:adenylate cyclase